MLKPSYAVVVIGKNEGKRLAHSLASIDPDILTVYADSGSTDNSREIARGLGAEVVALDGVKALTAARGRNAGARRALEMKPDLTYIQFLDGDCTLLEGWIEKALDFMQARPEAAVVCGQRLERDPQSSIYNAIASREWKTPIGVADACGGDSLVRVRAFVEVGGFKDDQVAHEEPEFCARLRGHGWSIWRIDANMTLHDADMFSVGQFYRRGRRAGFGIAQCLARGRFSYDRQGHNILRRAKFWAIVLPVAILATAPISLWLSAALASLYMLQILRSSVRNLRQGWSPLQAIKVACLGVVSKFAEAHGMITYFLRAKP
jgi:glycosyltransferase involved in cell wall biosynthesis